MEYIRDKTFLIYLLVALSSFMVPLQSAQATAASFRTSLSLCLMVQPMVNILLLF
jgi:hypothetical protein